tara:strand:+ start:108 stop:1244 length:1137 start_codon:yes stop_codon:yes gene_type:complete
MKIGIISRGNLEDKLFWSGVPNTIYTNFKKEKIKVVKIDNLNEKYRKLLVIKREYLKFLKKEKFDETYNIGVSKNYSIQLSSRLKNIVNLSHLLTFDMSLVSFLKTDIPIIVWTDILYTDYYHHYYKDQKISKNSLEDIKSLEYATIKKCKLILFSSRWSLNNAKLKYKKFKNKFKLLEFGPSLRKEISEKRIRKKIYKRKKNKIRLISLSVDKKRKGVDKQIKLMDYINKQGFKCDLTIIGHKSKIKLNNSNLKFLGFINKNNVLGEDKISRHLLNSHFHILLSSAEAYGISLIEANSRGLPNISFDVGGISHIVKNEKNGRLFKKNEKIEKIGNYITSTFCNVKKYRKLSISSYLESKKKFNYKIIISKFKNLVIK